MRFYQKIRFRLIVGAVVLVLAVAVLLTWYNQSLAKDVLRKREMVDLFDETNLRFREISMEILTLRGDMAGLVNGASVRRLQWAAHFEKGWIAIAPEGMKDKDVFLKDAKARAAKEFDTLLNSRRDYRRVEYYLDSTKPAESRIFSRSRKGFPDQTGRPLTSGDLLVRRATANDADVSFSGVRVWEDENHHERFVVLDACVPVRFADSKRPPGLLVVTVDFQRWAQAITRSPQHLVFLAGGNKKRQLLLYPRPDRPADYVMDDREARRSDYFRDGLYFTHDWDKDLQEDPSFQPTLPVESRYRRGPPPEGDDNWDVPENLHFLLLRCRVHKGIPKDRLANVLRDLRTQHPNLVMDSHLPETRDEVLIRGWPKDEQALGEVREVLTRELGSWTSFPDSKPILCKRFGRTLYKFSLEPRANRHVSANLPEEALYVQMATPLEPIDARIDDNWMVIWRVVGLCVLGAIALAVLGSFLVTRRLNAITRATQRFAAGKTDVRLPLNDTTEVGLLARSFADMIRQIQQRQRELQQRTSELETANADLALARDKAEQTTVAKDFFLASVSHELRTPLNHVLGFAQLLEMTELSDAQQRDLSKIQRSAANLLSLVDDLLDYQKMIQGVLTLEPTTIEFFGWIEELAETMRPKIAEKGNTLVLDCPPDIGTLDADEKRVRQAVTNLLSNAAKFTQKGVVTLSVRRERDEAREWLRIDVHDSGRGMTPDQQSQLFKPFTKLLSRSENPEGTGLGLTLSQRLCRLMGGDLVLSHSAPGEGSTFTIRLPAKTTAAATISGSASGRFTSQKRTSAPAPKAISVLVIDDDPDVRELMRRHLEEQGFTVHLAASGAEGLEMVKQVQPDAITLDVLMPGIDGWGTLAALQADADTAHIPVILITMLDDRRRGFALGAWEVLTKPVNWSGLIDLLHHLEPNTGPVLVVDDDPAFREMAERTLSHHGWEVCGAEDGRAALAAAARRQPVLVLLDLLMPGMDGFEFLEAFRKEAVWREVPVVVLTAKDLTEEEHRRLDGAVVRILYKGMSGKDELMMEIERLLRNRAHAGSVESHLMASAKPLA
jgi:signal transduction histidine kinase/CheY-like chemotaxis protein